MAHDVRHRRSRPRRAVRDLRRGRADARRAAAARAADRRPARCCAAAPSALGWQHGEIPRWMTYPGGDAGDGRRQSMTETYLPRAVAAGARLLVGHRVDRLGSIDGDRAVGRGRDRRRRADGPRRRSRSAHVVRLRRRDPDPGAAAALRAARPRRAHARRPPDGQAGRPLRRRGQRRPTTCRCTRSRSSPRTCRSAARPVEPGTGRPGAQRPLGRASARPIDRLAAASPCTTRRSRARAADGCGAVPGLRDPLVTYRLTRRDRALLGRGLARLALLLLEAGAHGGVPVVPRRARRAARGATWRRCRRRSRPRRASVMTVHLCSTVPMGERRQRSATDSFGRVRGTTQRVRQRRLAAARRARRQPAGVGDGGRHPQRPPLRRARTDRVAD